MLNINDINATIRYYEKQGTNLDNCKILADLYTCKDYIDNHYSSDTDKEFNDILPCYKEYCEIKKEYQLGNTTKEKVVTSMELVCKEIKEFIRAIYSGTDMQEERDLLEKLVTTNIK